MPMPCLPGLTEHLDAVTNAPSVEVLWDLHRSRMAEYGFDRLIYGYTRYRSGASLGDPDDWIVLTNQSAEYMDAFIGAGLYQNAPMLQWALENDGACSWRWMSVPGHLTPEENRVKDFNLQHGVRAGYTVSFRSVSFRSKGAIALTARAGLDQSDVDRIWDEHGEEIIVANNVAHLKLMTLPHSGSRRLTPRQREVLGWVGDGKTIQDIALLLEVSPTTIEKHLRLARESLSVETTAQAVLKAAFQNQMFVIGA